MAKSANILGLALNLVGIILLFVFGSPLFVRTGGYTLAATDAMDIHEVHLEHLYDALGWLGFALALGGTMLQILASLRD